MIFSLTYKRNKKESGNIVKNKIKRVLQKRFELKKISIDGQYLHMVFKVKNFIIFNSKSFSIKTKNLDIPFYYEKISKNLFSIKIDINYVINEAITFDFYYKGQMLWLIADKKIPEVLEIDNKVYIIKVDKSLILNQYKSSFDLAQNSKIIKVEQIDNEYVSFNTDIMV